MLIAKKETSSTFSKGRGRRSYRTRRSGRTLRKDCSRYSQRGFGLVPMLLGLAITSIIVLFASREISNYSFRQRQAEVAEDLHIISKAVHSLVERNPTAFSSRILSEGGWLSYSLADLKSKNVLIRSFPETNAIGQDYSIYFRAVGTNIVGTIIDGSQSIEALISTVTPPGHPVTYNNVSLLSYGGDNAIGLIQATNPTRLVGPSVDADITTYITQFGKPAVGETVVISHLNTEALIGSYLYREAIPGRNDLNIMTTDLNANGHDIKNVGAISSETLTVSGELKSLGDVSINGDLNVGNALVVNGTATITGQLSTDTATVTTDITSDSITVDGATSAQSIAITGALTAQTGDFSGQLVTDTLQTRNLNSSELQAQSLTSESANIKGLEANQIVGTGSITAETSVISTLTVTGSCTGC